MNIDWSKAPEGATHKDISCTDGFWYKFDREANTAAFCPTGKTEWVRSGLATAYNDGSMNRMAERPTKKEQLALKTRIVDEIVRDLDVPRAIAVRAYEAGYRKFEIVEGE